MSERERALRRRLPVGELSGGRGLVGREEARPDVVVERGVLLEPFVRPGLAPEGEHVAAIAAIGDHSRTSPLVDAAA